MPKRESRSLSEMSDAELLDMFHYFASASGVEKYRGKFNDYKCCADIVLQVEHELRERLNARKRK